MHGYYWNVTRLERKLLDFHGGQFLMEARVGDIKGLVFRGEIRFCSIPDMKKRMVLVYFNWLCERRFGVDKFFKPIPKWVLLEHPQDSECLNVEFTSYYFQRKREDREQRIKMWTPLGEVCRFFKKGDPSNLKRDGDEFLPCYEPPKSDSGPES